jgi:hypothetical protein
MELLSCTNNQPPVWMKSPESLLAKLPSPMHRIQLEDRRLTRLDVLDVELTGGEEVHTRDGSVANGDLTLGGVDVDTGESVEVVEEGAVRSTHGQLHLGQLGEDTEESHLGLSHSHLSEDTG